ncbi:MAG TPA: Vacuolar H+transporting two-sector ATPase F subunit [Thioalkalivibrio sp.]|nr:Vacuolar H+transporting two-sector ATPase F subunit [Thioalkalivibrio sp.]
MATIGFIGDELTAAGFRLAGATVETPGEGEFAACYERLRGDCDVLILTQSFAARLDAARRARDAVALRPLLIVIDAINHDPKHDAGAPDIAVELRRYLGMREDTRA